MDKYVLTIDQLIKLIEDSRKDEFDAKGSIDDEKSIVIWIINNKIPSDTIIIQLAWLEGFNKAKNIALEALNNA